MLLEILCWFLATLIVGTLLAFGCCAIVPLLFNLGDALRGIDAPKKRATKRIP